MKAADKKLKKYTYDFTIREKLFRNPVIKVFDGYKISKIWQKYQTMDNTNWLLFEILMLWKRRNVARSHLFTTRKFGLILVSAKCEINFSARKIWQYFCLAKTINVQYPTMIIAWKKISQTWVILRLSYLQSALRRL